MSGTTTTRTTKRHMIPHLVAIGVLTAITIAGAFGLATEAGAAPTPMSPPNATVNNDATAELGTSMSASMELDVDGNAVMIITEVAPDGTVTRSVVPAGAISGIEEARRQINLAAM